MMAAQVQPSSSSGASCMRPQAGGARPQLATRLVAGRATAPLRLLSRGTPCPSPAPRLAHGWPAPAARASASSSGASSFNPVEVVRREAGLQSNRLKPEVRERVEDAVENLGRRVTVGDVAARTGLKLSEADEALKALAYDTLAAMEVSSAGDLVYAFDKGFKGTLRSKSLLQRARPLLQRAAGAVAYVGRVAFGTALVSSVVLVWLAILAVLSGRGRDDDRRGGYGHGGGMNLRLFMDVTDLFFYWDPFYYRRTAERVAQGAPLSFVEAIFSFVFGDGDPNATFEERRWSLLGEMIRSKNGVVTAEEMAPYLDPPAPKEGAGTEPAYDEESFVLPALIKFGGEAVVDEDGHLLYSFPSLQRSGVLRGSSSLSSKATYEVPMERPWDFTAATPGQVAGTVALGGANLAGVAVLSSMLASASARYALAAQGLGFIGGLLPAFQIYAAMFFAIPAARWFLNGLRNQKIEAVNDARAAAADVLNRGGRVLQAKVKHARQLGRESGAGVVSKRDVVFATDRDATEQAAKVELDDWDKRIGGPTKGREWDRLVEDGRATSKVDRQQRGGSSSSSSGFRQL